jgi:hypothetical protein
MGRKLIVLAGMALGSIAMIACGPGYGAYVVAGPPAPYVAGPLGYAPGPGYVWVDGYWNLNGGRWGWVNGRWARPPYRGARWDRDRWERHGNNWRFHRGHWRR